MTAYAQIPWRGPLGPKPASKAFRADPDPAQVAWEALASEIVFRDGRRCRRCSSRRRLTVHHITPRAHGGLDQARNLITLCGSCHDRIEVAIAEGVPWFEIAQSLGSRLPDPPDVPSNHREAFVAAAAREYALASAHWGSNGETGGAWGVDPRGRVTFVAATARGPLTPGPAF